MVIERARGDDEAAIKRLLAASDLPFDDLGPAHLGDFFVLRDGDHIAGCAGLEIRGDAALLRSVAVEKSLRGGGHGADLVRRAEAHARVRGVTALYLLTTTAAPFFATHGYQPVERDAPPAAIRATAEFQSICPVTSACMTKRLAAINLAAALARFSEHWAPKIVARMNDYHFKLVKFQGEFVWHRHADTDEVFLVLEGAMTIHFRDGDVAVRAGEMFVIPKGVEHKTSAVEECRAMLVETAGTVNTGDAASDKTAPTDAWL
ncbi:MAG: GNAT family N-acetyltransferase [Candidatus Rokubacteria bacterium]|nr:GNAT family N-acetyltransferase [Candidatus Rokubacteria bacterium]